MDGKVVTSKAEQTLHTASSIVDWMKANDMDSSFDSRKILAEKNGIIDYQGSAEQNENLLNLLKQSDIEQTPTKQRLNISTSIVDWMKSNDLDSSFSNRKALAEKHGITSYRGTAKQNIQLLNLLKQSDIEQTPTKRGLNTSTSIVDWMKSNGLDSSFSNRKALAEKYGITNYRGTAEQNLQLWNNLYTETEVKPTNPIKNIDMESSNEESNGKLVEFDDENTQGNSNDNVKGAGKDSNEAVENSNNNKVTTPAPKPTPTPDKGVDKGKDKDVTPKPTPNPDKNKDGDKDKTPAPKPNPDKDKDGDKDKTPKPTPNPDKDKDGDKDKTPEPNPTPNPDEEKDGDKDVTPTPNPGGDNDNNNNGEDNDNDNGNNTKDPDGEDTGNGNENESTDEDTDHNDKDGDQGNNNEDNDKEDGQDSEDGDNNVEDGEDSDGDNDNEDDQDSEDGENNVEDGEDSDGDNDSDEEGDATDDGDSDEDDGSNEDNDSDNEDNDSNGNEDSDQDDNSGEEDGSDSEDNEEEEDTTPIFPINIAPVIKGVEDITIPFASDIDVLEGISAVDYEDGDLTPNIQVDGTVDTEKAGQYVLTYTVEDSKGAKFTIDRVITVQDNNAPTINVEKSVTLDYQSEFDALEGVTASDKEDGDLTEKVKVVSNNVDTNKVGEYKVVYEVEDAYGLKTTETVTVKVEVSDEQINQAIQEAQDSVKEIPDMMEQGVALWEQINGVKNAQIVKENPAEALYQEFSDWTYDFDETTYKTTSDMYYDNYFQWTEETRKEYNRIRLDAEREMQGIKDLGKQVVELNNEHAKTYDESAREMEKYVKQLQDLINSYNETLETSNEKVSFVEELLSLAEKEDNNLNSIKEVIEEKENSYDEAIVNNDLEKLFENAITEIGNSKEAYYSQGGLGWSMNYQVKFHTEAEAGLAGGIEELPIYVDPMGNEYFTSKDNPYEEGDWEGEVSEEEFNNAQNTIMDALETAEGSLTDKLINQKLAELDSQIVELEEKSSNDYQAFTDSLGDFNTQKENAQNAYNEAKSLADKENPTEEDVARYAELKSNLDALISTATEKYDKASLAYDTYETNAYDVINKVNDLSTNDLASEYDKAQVNLQTAKEELNKLLANGAGEVYSSEIREMQSQYDSLKAEIESMYENYQAEAHSKVDVSSLEAQLSEAKSLNDGLESGKDALAGFNNLPSEIQVVEEEPEEVEEEATEEETNEDQVEETVETPEEAVEETTNEDDSVDQEETVEEVEETTEEEIAESVEDSDEQSVEEVTEDTTNDEVADQGEEQ